MNETNEVLLERMRDTGEQAAWTEFYQLYWGVIIRYACKLGLSHAQAQDVLQETMMTLMRLLPDFTYDRGRGRFRNFLLTIVHRKALTTIRRVRRVSEEPINGQAELLLARLEEEPSETSWREALVEEALRLMRRDLLLDQRTVDVFFAYVVDCRSASDVACEFGIKENAVYQIKNRLLRRLQSEVVRLLRNSGA